MGAGKGGAGIGGTSFHSAGGRKWHRHTDQLLARHTGDVTVRMKTRQ